MLRKISHDLQGRADVMPKASARFMPIIVWRCDCAGNIQKTKTKTIKYNMYFNLFATLYFYMF